MAKSSAGKVENTRGRKLARDKVFRVAADLFYRKGIRAVGVEEIVQRAGVAKISLYRNFESKDDLIVAYLENRNAEFWRQWDDAFARYEDDPRAQLEAIMTHLAKRTTQPGYRGCPFINYCAEFPDPAHPGHRVAKANKAEWRRRFIMIAQGLDAFRPKQLADALLLLAEGAYAISQTLGNRKGPGKAIVGAAQALVEAHAGRHAADIGTGSTGAPSTLNPKFARTKRKARLPTVESRHASPAGGESKPQRR